MIFAKIAPMNPQIMIAIETGRRLTTKSTSAGRIVTTPVKISLIGVRLIPI